MNNSRGCYADDARSKRQHILDAAYEVFSKKGFHRATIDEIIAIADTGKGTVYNYFVNKEQLFYTLITERSTPFVASLEEVVVSQEQPLAKIETMIKLYLRFYTDNGDLWRVMMHEVRGFGSEALSTMKQEHRVKYQLWFTHTIGLLAKVLQEGVDQGALLKYDVNKAAYALFSVIVTMVFQKFVGEDIDTSAKVIADTLFYGIVRQ